MSDKRIPEQSSDNMSPEAHPATGEWTVDQYEWQSNTRHIRIAGPYPTTVIAKDVPYQDAKAIVAAHKAALAAEATKSIEAMTRVQQQVNDLAGQLADERKHLQSWLTQYGYKNLNDVAEELRKRCYDNEELQKQLDAKRQETQQLTGQVALMTVEHNEAKNAHKLIKQKRRIIEELQGQLSTEQKKREQAENDFITAGRNNEKLRQLLDAAGCTVVED